MNDAFFYEVFSPIVFFLTVFYLIAEFIGRSKHIGRWWTFFLMFGILPGIIALVFSPRANERSNKGNRVHYFLGVFILLVAVFSFISRINELGLSDLFSNVSLVASGLYLINFAEGKIINHNPKYYFEKEHSSDPKNYKHSNSTLPIAESNYLYFIIEEGKQSEDPLTFEQLKEKKITENTYVWRKGLELWLPAKEVPELHNILVFIPPPFSAQEDKKANELTPPPFNF